MNAIYLPLRELAIVIGMTPMGLSFILSGHGESQSQKYKTNRIEVHNSISVKQERRNKKVVELNEFVKIHSISNSYEEIDYYPYIYKDLRKSEYGAYFGECVETAVLKNVFKLKLSTISKIKASKQPLVIETGIKGIKGTRYLYVLEEIEEYLPDMATVRHIDKLFYSTKEITDILYQKYNIKVDRQMIYRNIDNLPSIRIRKTVRVSKPIFDSLTKEDVVNILKKRNINIPHGE